MMLHGFSFCIDTVMLLQGFLLSTAVDIAVCRAPVGPGCAHAVCIVGVGPGASVVSNRCQFPSVLPGTGPLSIAEDIANGIAGDSAAVIGGKQIAPVGIAVAVGLGGKGAPKCSGSIGIFLFAEDIARIIIGPGPALSGPLVIIPGQLVLAVIGIGSGVGAVVDSLDIAIGIVGIGIGGTVPRGRILQGGNLSAGLAGGGRSIGYGIRQNCGASMLGYPAADPAKGIIGIAYAVAVAAAAFCVLHQAVCEVVVVGSSPAGCGIGDRCQGTVIVVLIRNGVPMSPCCPEME